MPFPYDVEKDSFYLRGVEKGVDIGIEKGMERGVSKSAWQFFKAGFSIKMIAETLKISTTQVKKYIKEWESKS